MSPWWSNGTPRLPSGAKTAPASSVTSYPSAVSSAARTPLHTRQEFGNVEAASPPPAGSGMTPDTVQLWLVEFIARLAYLDPTHPRI
jgi:hypothetical protein